jgi:hypothetical protein
LSGLKRLYALLRMISTSSRPPVPLTVSYVVAVPEGTPCFGQSRPPDAGVVLRFDSDCLTLGLDIAIAL